MKLQTVLMVTLLSTLAISSQGKILKSLLKKKLALIPSLGGGLASGNKGSSTGLLTQQVVRPIIPTNINGLGEIAPLSETIVQPDIIDESSLGEEVHPDPASVSVYTYAPEYRTPSVYYRQSRPVISRTVYEYVEAPRNNLGVLPGLNLLPSLSGVKSLISNALRLPAAAAPATATATTYISYPPY